MITQNLDLQNTTYPWVTFKIRGDNYCITTEFVLQMIIQSTLIPMPQSSNYFSGLLHIRGESFPIIDLRLLFDMNTLSSEVEAFGSMKEKHLDWVMALEKSIHDGSDFLLARDPHKCAFGIWYDSFYTDNYSINHVLNKIDAPHKEMHKQAVIIDDYRAKNDYVGVHKAFDRAKYLCHNVIVPLLDDLIIAYTSANKGMIILLNQGQKKVGILVDDIASIENFSDGHRDDEPLKIEKNSYIKSIIVSSCDKIYFEIDTNALISIAKDCIED